jgi:hypothetical protein
MSWQYNGVAQWNDITNWCRDHLRAWDAKWETIYFQDEKEYTLFLLRWT